MRVLLSTFSIQWCCAGHLQLPQGFQRTRWVLGQWHADWIVYASKSGLGVACLGSHRRCGARPLLYKVRKCSKPFSPCLSILCVERRSMEGQQKLAEHQFWMWLVWRRLQRARKDRIFVFAPKQHDRFPWKQAWFATRYQDIDFRLQQYQRVDPPSVVEPFPSRWVKRAVSDPTILLIDSHTVFTSKQRNWD